MPDILNTKIIKEKNKALILLELKKISSGTKNSLSISTGLSIATCGNILKELILSDEVIELDLAKPEGGRPARRFQYNENHELILIIYIRKEHTIESLHLEACNLKGKLIFDKTITEPVTKQLILLTLDDFLIQYPKIKYLSIGIPGIVTKGTIMTCDIESLANLPLKEMIEKNYALKVIVENDVNAIALGYYSKVEDEKPESIVFLYYPEQGDPGAGIVIHGKTIYGSSNIAGEIKYLNQSHQLSFSEKIISVLKVIHYLINPNYMILSGNEIDSNILDCIQVEMKKSPFPPHILFEKEIHDFYVLGLKFNAYKLLTSKEKTW